MDKLLQLVSAYEKDCLQYKMDKIAKTSDKSKADDAVIDLTDIDEFAFSAIMRKLRKAANPHQVKNFLKLFKLYFDKAVKSDKHSPEKVALQNAVVRFSR